MQALEVFNEGTIIVFMHCMMCFSTLVADVEAKHKMGYVSCLVFSVNIMINLSIILVQSIRDQIQRVKGWWAKRQNKKNPLKIPVENLERQDDQLY